MEYTKTGHGRGVKTIRNNMVMIMLRRRSPKTTQKTSNQTALRGSVKVKDVLGGEKVRASIYRVTSTSYHSTRTEHNV